MVGSLVSVMPPWLLDPMFLKELAWKDTTGPMPIFPATGLQGTFFKSLWGPWDPLAHGPKGNHFKSVEWKISMGPHDFSAECVIEVAGCYTRWGDGQSWGANERSLSPLCYGRMGAGTTSTCKTVRPFFPWTLHRLSHWSCLD